MIATYVVFAVFYIALLSLATWGASNWRRRALNAEADVRYFSSEVCVEASRRNDATIRADRAEDLLDEEKARADSWMHAAVKRANEIANIRKQYTEVMCGFEYWMDRALEDERIVSELMTAGRAAVAEEQRACDALWHSANSAAASAASFEGGWMHEREHRKAADKRADESFARGWNSAIGVCQTWLTDTKTPRRAIKVLDELRTTPAQAKRLEAQARKGAA